MKRAFAFAKRNLIELWRDPLVYIFCIAFPFVMLALFCVMDSYAKENTPMFSLVALVPGIIMFSFSFVMLQASLKVSSDRSTSLLTRLFSSPMKTWEFLFGYAVPLFLIGVAQEIICMLVGRLLALFLQQEYFSLIASLLLGVEMLPILFINLALGIAFGCLLSQTASPGVSSILISASGVLGGAWMPLELMGGFEKFCSFLPFWQSVKAGRRITGAVSALGEGYLFDGVWFFLVVGIWLALSVALALWSFSKQRNPK